MCLQARENLSTNPKEIVYSQLFFFISITLLKRRKRYSNMYASYSMLPLSTIISILHLITQIANAPASSAADAEGY